MWIILYVICLLVRISMGITNYTFPSHFFFGLGSSAYQIEGGWDEDGKGVVIWDIITHEHLENTTDHSNGDVACDSYHLYKEDVKLLKQIGVDFYRFSISWSRILPTGFANITNQAGIDYYNNLINELLDNGIVPLVTMLHFDLPQPLQDIGGLLNEEFPDYFEMYADILFANFGDRVKWWISFNEPQVIVLGNEKNVLNLPGFKVLENGNYLATHNILLAHSKIYRLYQRKYKSQQKGKISISFYSFWFEPYSNSTEDKAAAERAIQFWDFVTKGRNKSVSGGDEYLLEELGIFAHPIFSDEGDYPVIVKERIANNSAAEGLHESRLPKLTQEEKEALRDENFVCVGSTDFFALNHYTTFLVKDGETGAGPSIFRDSGAVLLRDPSWESTNLPLNKVVPWGFYKLLVWVSKNYKNPPILITENGYADQGQLNDIGRINYIMKYVKEMLKAMKEESVNVFGYTLWSLMDCFEWFYGYTMKFGIFYVDFNSTTRNRTEKESAKAFSELILTRTVPPRYR